MRKHKKKGLQSIFPSNFQLQDYKTKHNITLQILLEIFSSKIGSGITFMYMIYSKIRWSRGRGAVWLTVPPTVALLKVVKSCSRSRKFNFNLDKDTFMYGPVSQFSWRFPWFRVRTVPSLLAFVRFLILLKSPSGLLDFEWVPEFN